MGGSKDFKAKGEYKYETVGMLGNIKVVRGIGKRHDAPEFAGNSTIYIRADKRNIAQEIIFYDPVTKARVKEINWGHPHEGFNSNDVHVHINVNGMHTVTRPPTAAELKLATKARGGEIVWN